MSTDGRGSATPCRSDRPTPWGSRAWIGVLLSLLALAGFWLGASFMRGLGVADSFRSPTASGEDAEVKYATWSILMGALVGFAAAACACFVLWLTGLARVFDRLRPAMVVGWLVTVVAVATTVIFSLWRGAAGAVGLDLEVAIATRPVTLFVWVCALPGLVSFLALRSTARDPDVWAESSECHLMLILRLRSELRRLLATFGVLLTVIVVTTGARRDALLAARPALQLPTTQVILYGLVFAVVLALFYSAASGPIDRRANELIDGLWPLGDPGDAAFSDTLRRRSELTTLMGAHGTWKSFETSVLIAAPLVSALIAGALGD